VIKSPDFFSTSTCRDLLFRVQVQQMVLAEIKAFLDENELDFIGFDAAVLDRYRNQFRKDRPANDHVQWHRFETENPDTFAGMYQFWIQKRR
jgi:hypothetical protein